MHNQRTGPMNSVALCDASSYLGYNKDTLTQHEVRLLHAKKKKIVTSSKKADRKISRELVNRIERYL